tara:strand:- start:261 stop:452 length:192 start_codon:yes stop_codon:yes gene_type:complete
MVAPLLLAVLVFLPQHRLRRHRRHRRLSLVLLLALKLSFPPWLLEALDRTSDFPLVSMMTHKH